jgi:aminoglycoside phosphotransferase (APT) family kinase protein
MSGTTHHRVTPWWRWSAGCPDESVLGGAVFYLMEPVDGFNAASPLPRRHADDHLVRYRMGFAMVEALARMGAVDYEAVGLADFGRPF